MTALLSWSDEGVFTSSGPIKTGGRGGSTKNSVCLVPSTHTPPKIAWPHGPHVSKYPPVMRQGASRPLGLPGVAGGTHTQDQTGTPGVRGPKSRCPLGLQQPRSQGAGGSPKLRFCTEGRTPTPDPDTHIYTQGLLHQHHSRKVHPGQACHGDQCKTLAPQVLSTSRRTVPALLQHPLTRWGAWPPVRAARPWSRRAALGALPAE